MIVSVLGGVPEGVIVTWQVAVVPVPDKVQGEVAIVPAPLLVIATVPVGVLLVPVSVSFTVAVHWVELPTATEDGEQLTVVEVVRGWTVTVKAALGPLAA